MITYDERLDAWRRAYDCKIPATKGWALLNYLMQAISLACMAVFVSLAGMSLFTLAMNLYTASTGAFFEGLPLEWLSLGERLFWSAAGAVSFGCCAGVSLYSFLDLRLDLKAAKAAARFFRRYQG